MNKDYHPTGTSDSLVYVKKQRGAGFWIAVGFASFFFLCSLFLFMLFIGSILLSKSLLTSTSDDTRDGVSEIILGGKGETKIAIISINGVLSNEPSEHLLIEKPSIVEAVKKQIKRAARDESVKAVLFEINSPGGGITASDIIYNEIMQFRSDTHKKVVVYMEDIAASGGYYISAAADMIVAHPTTITGSIGVIIPLINVSEFINRYGVVDNSIASGDMKKIGSPLKHMTKKEAAVLKNIIDEMYMQFVEVVSAGRDLDKEEVREIADGRIYTGKQALERGLVDKLGYLEDAITTAKKEAGLTDATIVRYKKRYGLGELFGLLVENFCQKNTIKLDIPPFHDQYDTKPMYLWNGYTGDK